MYYFQRKRSIKVHHQFGASSNLKGLNGYSTTAYVCKMYIIKQITYISSEVL